jgi:DNA repair protein RadA/Sms
MARTKTAYICRSCGSAQTRWMGKCPDCDAWNALEEHREPKTAVDDPHRETIEALAGGWGVEGAEAPGMRETPRAIPISQASGAPPVARIQTGIHELDRVLGGGLVPGSVALVGGDPGIGKSTLMLQAAGATAAHGARTLYVTSEESAEQVRLRAGRLGVGAGKGADNLLVLADTNLARILEQARRSAPAVMIVDSIQMIYRADVEAAPGSVGQLRRCCTDLVYLAKSAGVAVLLVGHVTKEGALAGPKLVEHLVDVVLGFEGDRYHAHRIVRAVKNRFGATLEVGIFEMTGEGLREASDGASVAAEAGQARPGSVVCPVLTGSRTVLVELQALTASGFPGSVKRKASGVDSGRLAMLIAVLEQHAGMRLGDRDVFASAVGGLKVSEPAADLALALAIGGALLRRSLPEATAAVGEIGLGGEIRPVGQMEARLREAVRLGYKRVLVPAQGGALQIKGLDLAPVRNISLAVQELA